MRGLLLRVGQRPTFAHLSRLFHGKKETIIELQGDILYGIQPVQMAAGAKRRTIHKIYYNRGSARAVKIVEDLAPSSIPCQQVSRYILDEISRRAAKYKDHHVHQGILADVSRLYHIPVDFNMPQVFPDIEKIRDLFAQEVKKDYSGRPPLWLVLCGIKDPMNLGSILRTSYYLGVDKIIVTGDRCDLSSVVSKASAGALECTPIFAVRHAEDFLLMMKKAGWKLMALTLPEKDASLVVHPVHRGTLDKPTLMLVGSEGSGIPAELLTLSDMGLYIPHGITSISDSFRQGDQAEQATESLENGVNSKQNGGFGTEIGGNHNMVDNNPVMDSLNVSVAVGIVLHSLLSKCHKS